MTKRNLLFLTFLGFIMFVSLAVVSLWLTQGASPDIDTLAAANRLYEAGNYQEAVKIYEGLLAEGLRNSSLFYNLGNAYYQQGDLGRAVLNYERAAQLAPRDVDIKMNLAIARSQAEDDYPVIPGGPLESVGNLTARWLTLNEVALVALSTWFLLIFLLMIRRGIQPGGVRGGLHYILYLTLFVVILTGASLGSRIYAERIQPDAVIVVPEVPVSSDPDEEHATGIQLHSGTEVNLLEAQGEWIRMSLPGEIVQGWIPTSSIELVDGEPL